MTTIMLCYMEIGTQITSSGGSYAYVEAAFGDFTGFTINWLYFFGFGVIGSAAVIKEMLSVIIFIAVVCVIYFVMNKIKNSRVLEDLKEELI